MIFACPSCEASHFKPDSEVENGADVVCRRCRHEFRVDLDGVHDDAPRVPETPSPAPAAARGEAPLPPEAADVDPFSEAQEAFDSAATAVMKTPQLGPTSSFGGSSSDSVAAGDTFGGPTEAIDVDDGLADLDSLPGGAASVLASDPSGLESTQIDVSDFDDASSAQADVPDELSSPDSFAEISEELIAARNEARGETVLGESELESALREGSVEHSNREYDDDLTGMHNSESPDVSPSSARAAKDGLGPVRNALKSVRVTTQELVSFIRLQPFAAQVGLGLALLALFGLTAAVAASFGAPSADTRWVKFDASLRSGPRDGAGYRIIDRLLRGSEVKAFGSVGSFTLVEDSYGRVGYLASDTLTASVPTPSPDEPFAGCRHAPIEPDAEPCRARARGQLDRCTEGCQGSRCERGCKTQFTDCMAGCDTRLVVVDERPAPSPVAEAEPLPASVEAPSPPESEPKPAEEPVTERPEEASVAAPAADPIEEPREELGAEQDEDGAPEASEAQLDSEPESNPSTKKRKRSKKKKRKRKRRR